MKRPKYGNRAVVVDGHTFDSAKEAKRYGELMLLQKAGAISGLELQPVYRLEVNGKLVCKFIPDFRYIEAGDLVVEDVKSAITRVNRAYRLKMKLIHALYGIEIRET